MRSRSVRRVLVGAAVLLGVLVTACGEEEGGAAQDGQPERLRAAIINVAPVSSGDWEPANYDAFMKMTETWGMEASNEDSVGYDEAEAVLSRLAQTNDLVIASSAGYGDAVLKAAESFPDTFFVVFSNLDSTGGLPNVAGFSSDWNEFGYVSGAVACFAAEGGKIGHVNSEPIPAFTKFAGGAQQAAEEHCENGEADYLQTWIRSFTDISKAKQASLQLISRGASVLMPTADTAGLGVVQAAKERDAKLIMSYVDQSALAPENVITSWRFAFEEQYDRIGELFSQGELEPKIYEESFASGGIDLVLPLANVTPEVNERAEQLVADLEAGEIDVEDRELRP